MKSNRIIRRTGRPAGATQALPDCIAMAMDSKADDETALLTAYVGLTVANLGIVFMRQQSDTVLVRKAALASGQSDPTGSKQTSMLHTLWLDLGYKQVPGALVDPYVVPPHALLLDETLVSAGPRSCTFTVTAYRLDQTTRKDENDVDVVDVPVDPVDMMLSLAGSMEIRIEAGGCLAIEPLGCFAEPGLEKVLAQSRKLDLPDIQAMIDDGDDS